MKRMTNLLKGAVVVLGLFFATNVANAQQKIGHINADEVFQLTPEFKTATEQLKALSEEKQKEIEAMITELQKKEKEAEELLRNQSEANKVQTQTKLDSLQKEYQQMQQRIQRCSKSSARNYRKKTTRINGPYPN
ncbi:OmpH family outer membrane protein [Sphingobacterium sp. T2]|uniref:OmpH family outer membrane protein n=1 Tax=Sphingobacterium sp. T2 TaxID=1590596 RepID=UPI0009E4AEE1|nr:OmpH family outer membrane protein [Sphingobacterium sp. T2]